MPIERTSLRTAARGQLAVHADALKRTVERKTIQLGLENYTRQQLEDVRAAGRRLQIRVPRTGHDCR
jgi:hypothetical protein